MRWVVTYWPPGHNVFSSTRTLPPPSWTRRVAHGSGTQAPSIWPPLKASSVWALSWGRMETSPPPSLVVARPLSASQVRSATSWVLPSCGDATVLPRRTAADVISGLTTRYAPPDVAPAMIRIAAPLDLAKALIAGFGPMNVASIAPFRSASDAAGPALKDETVNVTPGPRAFWMIPLSTPTIAVAWVMFGK